MLEITKLTFVLDRPAKKGGGDRYACTTVDGFTVYVPQSISRFGGKPIAKMTITFDTEEK